MNRTDFIEQHPCLDHEAHFRDARLHLPVAPKCNIRCNYCDRKIGGYECRPGVTSRIISPKRAIQSVEEGLRRCENLTVVGIAGPGEPLANPETFEVLKHIHNSFPSLIKCIATNGLLLPMHVKRLITLGVHAVSVTINTVNPVVGTRIYSYIAYKGRVLEGLQAASQLIDNQLRGVEMAASHNLIVKVNTVLIPEVNTSCIEELASEIARRGAYIQNIIPLIPQYKFSSLNAPSPSMLKEARDIGAAYIRQFDLCKLCRADALGVPGKCSMHIGD